MNVTAFPKLEHARDVNDNHVQDDTRNSDNGTDGRCRNVQLVVPAPKRFRQSQPIRMTEERCPVPAKENINSSPVAGLGMPAISHLPWQLPLYRSFHQFPFLQYPGYASYPFPVLPEHVHQNPYHAEYMKYFPNAVMLNSLHVPAVSPFFASSKELEPERTSEKLKENDNILSKIANEEMKDRRENSGQLIRTPTVFLDKDSVTDLKKKEGQTDNVKYQCDSCSKTYSTFSGLSKHKQFHCAQELKKEFACKYCEKTYVSLGALKMHIRTHTLPCKCKICGKSFSRPWLLQGHVRTHTGEKPFTCVHCLRAFADRSNLRAHLQTHSDVKKYSCRSCSKTFSRMSLLLKHEDTCKSIAL